MKPAYKIEAFNDFTRHICCVNDTKKAHEIAKLYYNRTMIVFISRWNGIEYVVEEVL